MKGFIIQTRYEKTDEKPAIHIFGRLENGDSFLVKKYYRPYFYILKKDTKKAQKIENIEIEDSPFKNFKGDQVSKIYTDSPKNIFHLRQNLEENHILTFESDIKFTTRFLIDHKIQGAIEIEGEFKKGRYVDRIYTEPEIRPAKVQVPLKILSIDIETDKKAKQIYCIALATKDKKVVLIDSSKNLKDAISCTSEKAMLIKFLDMVKKIDPDIITGWHVIDFDLKIIRDRCRKHKLDFILGRNDTPAKIRVLTDFFKDSTIDIPGRAVLDGIQTLRNSFIKLDNFKLDTAAKKYTKRRKLLNDVQNKIEELERLFKEEQQKLVDYNLMDADLVLEILEKSGALNLTIQRSLLTGMQLDKVSASIASLDSIYIKETRKRKLVVPSRHYIMPEERIKGGYVQESKPGIYDNIIVLDFKSLYPSIIRTFNIDPLTFTTDCKGNIQAPNGACFKRDAGILPSIIETLLDEREKARKKGDELARYAIKILMNSFYGVLASPNCRFFNQNIANAITHFGQLLIKQTSEKVKAQGYDVIYGDTDSIFVKTKAETSDEAEKIGHELENYINDFYRDYIRKEYKTESHLQLEYEKCFIKFLLPKLRGTEKGAKKRYAGLIIEEGKEKISITGMEFVRGDWTQLAKDFQYELLDKIFHNKEIKDYITKFVENLRSGKFNDKLIYRKSLRKNVKDYLRTTPPHVKAARKLAKIESTKIEYVITEDGPEPIQNIKHKIDYEHYLNKQLRPIADTILIFFGLNFDDILKGKQTTLFGF